MDESTERNSHGFQEKHLIPLGGIGLLTSVVSSSESAMEDPTTQENGMKEARCRCLA